MCAAAIAHARIARLVFGAWDPRQGAAGSAFNLVAAPALNHRVDSFGGVLSEDCGALLSASSPPAADGGSRTSSGAIRRRSARCARIRPAPSRARSRAWSW